MNQSQEFHCSLEHQGSIGLVSFRELEQSFWCRGSFSAKNVTTSPSSVARKPHTLHCTLTLPVCLPPLLHHTQPDWSIWSGINFDGRVVPLQCSSARDLVFFPVWGIEGDSAWFACHVVERFAEQSLVGVMKPPNVWRRPRGRSNLGWSFRRPVALSQLTVLPMLLSMLPRCSFKPYTTTHISHGVVWSYWLPLYCAPSLASQTLSVSQSLLRSGDLGPLCVTSGMQLLNQSCVKMQLLVTFPR